MLAADEFKFERVLLADTSSYNPKKCMARTWGKGWGAQCSKSAKDGSPFCVTHAKEAHHCGGVPSHGRIDGPIPEPKRKAFEAHQAAETKQGKTRVAISASSYSGENASQ